MARRFEPRSKHAPMEYTYEKPEMERIAPWSPFKEALERSRGQSQQPNATPSTSPEALHAPTSPHSPFQSGTGGDSMSLFTFVSTRKEDPFSWTPPANFSPQKAFPASPLLQSSTADVSMSTAGSETPDASPTLARRVRKDNFLNGAHSSPFASRSQTSPLRRSAIRARERDRSRERERQHDRRRGLTKAKKIGNETSSDDEQQDAWKGKQYHLHFPGPSLLHGDVPYVLSRKVLDVVRINVGSLRSFMVWSWLSLQFIVMSKNESRSIQPANILREMAHCSKQYLDNRCEPSQRVPHMEETCRAWEECMHRDPSAVGRARIFAETAAQVVNGFVEEISWKTLVSAKDNATLALFNAISPLKAFTLVSLGFLILFANSLLSLYRSHHPLGTSTASSRQSHPYIAPSYQPGILPPVQTQDSWPRAASPVCHAIPALSAAPPSPSKSRSRGGRVNNRVNVNLHPLPLYTFPGAKLFG
ncbi:Di-sulfide bridge nucleocytoplasmic transport domain-containing protein [Cantharellus anzutake]|uniref:Di-sulfide bridge nucleocytoplasmic transport domain-containing protein n=1 Tax=Cantharellus anzutake TaxID=1750568 RepID=UPI001905BE47|nr:Di-sulfide bridge nucleocytoplasmic transport domain-containing protein [Cantharellus anzutake]KAF8330434.1 Di-sulfide bridge nucleocytoplasmic transport domain-containing protein [Cantharellus anzutake]